jgi:hypothetical protein
MRGVVGVLMMAACSSSPTVAEAPDAATCACASTVLATVDGSPIAFGIDDANVFWRSPWQSFFAPPITAISKDGGTPTATPGVGCEVSGTIVADELDAYAPCETNVDGLGQFPKSGTAMVALVPGSAVSQVFIDSSGDVFWAGGGGIWQKPPSQSPTQVVTGDVVTFAVDSTGLYWWGLDRTIHSSNAAIATAEVPLGGLVADGTTLFWLDTSTQTINAAPHAGTPVVLLSGLERPSAIAVDASFVYAVGVFQRFSGLVRVPKTGGAPTFMFIGEAVSQLAVDDDALYTTDTRVTSASMAMSIVRITKP